MTGLPSTETLRGGGSGGQIAMSTAVVAAVLLAVVDVLAAFDNDGYHNLRPRHRIREIEVDFPGFSEESSEDYESDMSPSPIPR